MRHDWRDALSMARKETDSIDTAKTVILASFAAGMRDPLPMFILRRKFGAGERLAHMLGAEADDRYPVSADLLAPTYWQCDAAVEAQAAAIARRRAHHAPAPREWLREFC